MSTCFICNGVYDNYENLPRVIPCGHTYCEVCLLKVLSILLIIVSPRNAILSVPNITMRGNVQ